MMEQPETESTKKETLLLKQDRFIEAFKSNLFNVSAACREVGVSRSSFYRWYDGDEIFRQRLNNAREEKIDFAESALFQKIQKGDTIAIIFFLKTIGKSRGYIEQQDWRIQADVKKLSKEHRDSVIQAAINSMQTAKLLPHQNDEDSSAEEIVIEHQG
jgi:AcrR family transcriptional regulator